MAASYNKVILMGNLTRDPELRYTPKGTAVAKIGLAVNRQWKSESGEQKEEVTFIDIEAWGRQAEVISQYMKKGSPLFIEGRLKLDSWEDKNTKQKVSKLVRLVKAEVAVAEECVRRRVRRRLWLRLNLRNQTCLRRNRTTCRFKQIFN
jgi:single stranded DNA-binding protein